MAVSGFLDAAQPIWHNATKEILANITERAPNGSKGLQRTNSAKDLCNLRLLSSDLEVTDSTEVEVLQTELSDVVLSN